MPARPAGTRDAAPTMAWLLLVSLVLSRAAESNSRDDIVSSLRRALRAARAAQAATRNGRQLSAVVAGKDSFNSATPLCSITSSDCFIELTTGIAGWVGASVTTPDPNWAPIFRGAWIGDADQNTAPSILMASVSFQINEPGCASFDLAVTSDGRVRSAQLNGKYITISSHGQRANTLQEGAAGLVAPRGSGLFAHGTNSLVITVSNDAGGVGLYVLGSVQLLCPLDEAIVSMKPTLGPTAGHTTITLTSNVKVGAQFVAMRRPQLNPS